MVKEMQGWIKLYRKIQENDIWKDDEPFDKRSAFIDMLLMANHNDKKIMFNKRLIEIKTGQFITSVRKLAARWNWSNGKVIRFIDNLVAMGMVEKRNTNGYTDGHSDGYTNGYTNGTLLTIVNYGIYQGMQNSDEYTNEQEIGTAMSDQTVDKQEIKNKRIKKSICNIIPPDVEWVRAYCQERKNGIDAQLFCDYYEARGWKLKTGLMKNWQACVRTWENREKKEQKKDPGFQQTKYDFDALNKMINGD